MKQKNAEQNEEYFWMFEGTIYINRLVRARKIILTGYSPTQNKFIHEIGVKYKKDNDIYLPNKIDFKGRIKKYDRDKRELLLENFFSSL